MTSNKSSLIFFLAILFLGFGLNSCASHKYTQSERLENNKVIIKSNVKNFQLSYENMNERQFKRIADIDMRSTEGVFVYQIPKLKRIYTKLKVEAPGYGSQVIKIKRVPRGKVIVKDELLTIFTIFIPIPLAIDVFRSDFYKISKNTKEIYVELAPTNQ